MEVARLSALRTGRFYRHGKSRAIISFSDLVGPRAERVNSVETFKYPIENRTRDLPACRAVLQITAPPGIPFTFSAFTDF